MSAEITYVRKAPHLRLLSVLKDLLTRQNIIKTFLRYLLYTTEFLIFFVGFAYFFMESMEKNTTSSFIYFNF